MKESIIDGKVKEHLHDASFNEKRKWQIALRRYVINKSKSNAYAPYFGIEIEGFRNWIETQFDETMTWDNFSAVWQFEHIVPIAYFDLNKDAELRLCWSFINIKPEKLHTTVKTNKPDVQRTKVYFETLYEHTHLLICTEMVKKINSIHIQELLPNEAQLIFLKDRLEDLQVIAAFSVYEFDRLNSGDSIKTLVAEQELMNKFG